MPVSVVPPPASATAAQFKKPLPELRPLLHKHISRKDVQRPPWNLHASDITREEGFCPLYPLLMKQYDIPLPSKNVTTSMAVTWEWGRLVERRTIQYFADMGLAFGHWVCAHRGCRHVHEWQHRPETCAKCGGAAFGYEEFRAKSEYSGASSGLDMLLKFPERPLLVFTEIKSIDAEAFKKLVAPLAEHRARTLLSLRNIEESTDPRCKQVDDQVAFTLYVSKGGYGVKTAIEGGFSPFKDYPISRNDKAIEHYVAASREAHLALKGEGPMPGRVCSHHTDKKAQYCPAMSRCFGVGK